MPKFVLPLGLFIGAIATTSLVTPALFSQSRVTGVQAQFVQTQSSDTETTQADLEAVLSDIASAIEVNQNQILFRFDDQSLLLITDTEADRMRIVLPVARVDEISAEDMAKMMIANFHTALDGRYAIGNGVVYAAFVHPLSSLQTEDFKSAVSQVASLGKTFGSTYSSGTHLFGVPLNEPDPKLPTI